MREKIANFFINCLEDDLLVDEITKINKTEDLFKLYQKYNSDCTEQEFNTVIEEILKMSELDENSLEKVSGGVLGKRATSTALSVAMLATPFLAPDTKAGKVIENSNGYVFKKVGKDEDKEKSFLEKHWDKFAASGAAVGILTLLVCSKLKKSDNQMEISKGPNLGSGTRTGGGSGQTPKPNVKKFSELVDNYKKIDINIDKGVGDRIHVIIGDITKIQTENNIKVDAIVNAASSKMRGGGGVDGAVHGAAGKDLLKYEESNNLSCPCGNAVATPAFDLGKQGQKRIIHTVAPQGLTHATNDKRDLMKNCYEKSIECARENNCNEIAFPPLGVGIFKCDLATSTSIAWMTVAQKLSEPKYKNMHVYFTCIPFINNDAASVMDTVAIYKAFAEKNGIDIIDRQNYLNRNFYAS